MQTRDLSQIAAVLGVEVPAGAPGDLAVGPDVVIDSRAATPGALFIALPGEHVDGHDYIAAAAERGAVASIGTRLVQAEGLDRVAQFVVDDTDALPGAVGALSALARDVVSQAKRHGLLVVAITGSSGKTSTKDLLAQILESAGPTVAPVGSFNNEIGVPLTACRIDATTRHLVSEMGARGVGHIAWLCSMTPPDIAAVLNVGTAHLGEFGSVDAIAQAKGEIVEALPATGCAVLNADDHRVAAMAERTAARLVWFSQAEAQAEPDDDEIWVRAEGVRADALQRHSFDLVVHGDGTRTSHPVTLPLLGAHHVANALAAAAMAIAAGVEAEVVAEVLSRVETRSHWRMELTEHAGVAIINDAYNANPDSMRAALAAVGAIGAARRAARPTARVIAVLGDMLELGAESSARHREVAQAVAEHGFDELVAIGGEAAGMVAVATEAGVTARVATVDEASSLDLHEGDVVLVKASRGLSLEKVAERLGAGLDHLESGES